jgi:hypothetical protein
LDRRLLSRIRNVFEGRSQEPGKDFSNYLLVGALISPDAMPASTLEGSVFQKNQRNVVSFKYLGTTYIINSSLDSAMKAAHCLAFVEKRSRLAVLAFSILYDKSQLFIVGVDGKQGASSVFSRVAPQKLKSMLPACC